MAPKRPTKATLAAEVKRVLADYAAACEELKHCRQALRRERQARWGIRPLDQPGSS
jgi:UDP:flavonoid glycosyltransferase YjiC (YdhE family)